MPLKRMVGTRHGVSIEVAACDAASVAVELSCACMFAHEVDAQAPRGGLAHLDGALGGRLLTLRGEGSFQALIGQILVIDTPPSTITARS